MVLKPGGEVGRTKKNMGGKSRLRKKGPQGARGVHSLRVDKTEQ